MAETINGGRTAALALVTQVERRAVEIERSYDGGDGLSDSYAAFRDFTERLDQFHVFALLVEGKLGDIEAGRRAAQAQTLVDTRWRLMLLEIAAMQSFMTRFLASRKPWPLGSQAFLDRRGARLDEIVAFQHDGAAQYKLTPPDEAQIASVRRQFTGQSGLSLPLDDFSQPDPAAAPLRSDTPQPGAGRETETAATADLPEPEPPAVLRAEPPRQTAAAATAADGAPASFLKPKKRLAIRVEGENVYLDGESAAAVNEACKQAGISLDDLARKMGLSRATLVLMLNGSDAVERKPLNQLRSFVSQNGGLV